MDKNRFPQGRQVAHPLESCGTELQNEAVRAVPEVVGVREIGSEVRDAKRPAFQCLPREGFRETTAEDEADMRVRVRMFRNKNARRVPDFFERESRYFASFQRGAVQLPLRHASREPNSRRASTFPQVGFFIGPRS